MCGWKHTQRMRVIAMLLVIAAVFQPAHAFSAEEYEKTRSESVYVDLSANGSPTSIIASVYLTNSGGKTTLTDYTTLTDVSNVLGNDKPQIEGNAVTFQADGDDVCYQGTGHTTPPISVSITYTLDGKEIQPMELRGKSGRVGIEIKTQNHSKTVKLVEGEPVTLYTPFSVICIMTLNEGFSAIEADSGQVRAGGGTVSVMGILHPGLKESLGLEDAEEIHDSLSVYANVKDFAMDGITFVAMTGLVDDKNLSALDDVRELIDGIDEMADATDELYDGTVELRDGVEEYVDGIKELRDGAKELREGTNEYVNGVAILHSGLLDAVKGAGELASGTQELVGGVAQLQSELRAQAADSSGALVFAEKTTEVLYRQISGLPVSLRPYIQNAIMLSYQGASQQMLTQLLSAISQLSKGSGELSGGVEEFRVGLKKIASGSAELAHNGKDLYKATADLEEGVAELSDGTEELYDGTTELVDGVAEFRDEGIKEMQEQTADIGVSLKRKDALLALSDSYTSYSSTDARVAGSVEFIMTTEDIHAERPIETAAQEEESTTQIEIVEKEVGWLRSLWNWIKAWFSKE